MSANHTQPFRSESVALSLIDIPADTRDHDPQEIEMSALNLEEIGQLQPIAVLIKEGGRFEVIFGKGRVLAARKAGQTQIDARIYQGLSTYQRLEMMYSENRRREKPNPIYEARLLQGMLDTHEVKTQTDLAKMKGMSQGMLSDYLSFLKFPDDAIQIFSTLKISFFALQVVKALPEEAQLQVAQEIKEGKLKPEDVAKRCKQLSSGQGKRAKEPKTDIPNPLADLWASLHQRSDFALGLDWEARYGVHKPAPGISLIGYLLFVGTAKGVSKSELISWLRQVLQALESTGTQTPKEVLPEAAQAIQGIEQTLIKSLAPRLPQNPQEQAELEAIALHGGPKAVYSWIYGAASPMTQAAPQNWADAGMTWEEGLRRVLEGIRMMQGLPALPAPAKTAPAMSEERARRLAAVKAKYGGRIL